MLPPNADSFATDQSLASDLEGRPGWRVVRISARRRLTDGVSVINGRLFDGASAEAIGDLRPMETLPGAHNWQNAAATYAVARILGMEAAQIFARMADFPGLPHRQELVAIIDGVRYVNDSKATNGEAAARALACYQTIYWIVGGVPKEDGLAPIGPHLSRVRHAYLIGEATVRFAAELDGQVPVTQSNDLASAVRAAHLAAHEAGSVVLLSPACASFDQWTNFTQRGDAFRDMISVLASEGAT